MDKDEHESDRQPEDNVKREVLNAIAREAAEESLAEKDSAGATRKVVTYSSVQTKEALGTIFLGILSCLLLLALIMAHRRNEKEKRA